MPDPEGIKLKLEDENSLRAKLSGAKSLVELYGQAAVVLSDMEQNFYDSLTEHPSGIFRGVQVPDAEAQMPFLKIGTDYFLQHQQLLRANLQQDILFSLTGLSPKLVVNSEKMDAVVQQLLEYQELQAEALMNSVKNETVMHFVRRVTLKSSQMNQNDPRFEEIMELVDSMRQFAGLSLSAQDYEDYFQGEIKQSDVGNCNFVALLHSLSQLAFFEVMVRSGIKKLDDGSWEVKIPLIGESSKTVLVFPEELEGVDKGGRFPIRASVGYRILEAAYYKNASGEADWKREDAVASTVAFEVFFGEVARHLSVSLGEFIDNKDFVDLKTFLKDFKPGFVAVTLDIQPNLGGPDRFYAETADDTMVQLIHQHSYSLVRINTGKETVTLANPWNTAEEIDFTFDQLKESFDVLTIHLVKPEEFYQKLQESAQFCAVPLSPHHR